MKQQKIYGIQALRVVAAVLVFFSHLPKSATGHSSDYFAGGVGVDIFFIISGFVMAMQIEASGQQGPRHASIFFAKRLARIWPMYIAATLLTAAIAWGLNSQQPEWGYIAWSASLWPVTNGGFYKDPLLIVGWTLSFEMYFYLLLAILLFVGLAKPVVLTLVVAILVATSWIDRDWTTAQSIATSPMLLEFLAGYVTFFVYRRYADRLDKLAWPLLISGAAALLVAMTGDGNIWFRNHPFMQVSWFDGRVYIARWAAWGIPAYLLFLGVLGMERRLRLHLDACRIVDHLGNATYAFYLLHLPAIVLISQIIPTGPGQIVAYLIMPAGLSIAASHCLEMPFNRWIGRKLMGFFFPCESGIKAARV